MSEPQAPAAFLEAAPTALHASLQNDWARWQESCEKAGIDAQLDGKITLQQLGLLFACSGFLARTAIRYPHELLRQLTEGIDVDHDRAICDRELSERVDDIAVDDNESLRRRLREFRSQRSMRIAVRDLTGVADIHQLMLEQSDLADSIVDVAIARAQQSVSARVGIPRAIDGRSQRLVVLAMGKLGGRELNFSSDIDLIFCYPEDGETDGRRSISNHEYFLRVIREFVPLLDDATEDGFVFRVDARLRPYGNSGPMAMSFSAMENYYASQGREWERYAMIKARAVSGDTDDIEQLQRILLAFVYRRYLDYTVFDGVREMKAMIAEQVRRKSMQRNIKLGRGGIREIEFIVQTFQLIRGSQDARLQSVGLRQTLEVLGETGLMAQGDVDDLLSSYVYLRTLENRIQIQQDQQRHELPSDDVQLASLVTAMRCGDAEQLTAQIAEHTEKVRRLFDTLIQQTESELDDGIATLQSLMKRCLTGAEEHGAAALDNLGDELLRQQPALQRSVLDAIMTFRGSPSFQNASAHARDLAADLLVALLLQMEQDDQDDLLQRLVAILQAVMGRSVYLSMMLQHPGLQRRLLWLARCGEWFTDQIRAMPLLLDDLVESDVEQVGPLHEQLSIELASRTSAVAPEDTEQILESLRVFKQSGVFRVAMLDIIGAHRVTDLSDLLSRIAELVVDSTLRQVWDELVRKHGHPGCEVDGERQRPGMAAIAYGKLGGHELGYASDLDIVFIHNSRGHHQHTDGDQRIENAAFFARVVRKFLHYMGTRTLNGVLYEVDTRLRPDGKAGLMVSSIEAFERYQNERAWTWEHQALIRARTVSGDPNAVQEFARIRSSALIREREWPALARDIVDMRRRMHEHRSSTRSGLDLKQDAGGLIDIEFIAQAGVLQSAARQPAMLETTATIQLLARLGEMGWLSSAEVSDLTAAYATLRQAQNHRTLGVAQPALIERCEGSMRDVRTVWNRLFQEYETPADTGRS